MAVRQNAAPVAFDMTRRMDNASILTSGKAGVVIPVSCVPLFRGDSASGRLAFDLELAEMPKPLENAVIARAQAWFVPRPALPQFSGLDEYTHAYQGEDITVLGASARTPASLYATVGTGAIAAAQSSEFFTALGLHLQAATAINTDYIDAYALVQNYRLSAHSSKMTRYDYYSEDAVTSLELKPAFWPPSRMHSIVPDYEAALVTGQLDLDISAGSIPITRVSNAGAWLVFDEGTDTGAGTEAALASNVSGGGTLRGTSSSNNLSLDPDGGLEALLTGETIVTSLATLEKARATNAFAKARAQYAGTNFSGFNDDDVITAELMQGFAVPPELMHRPWLLDSKTVVFGLNERHATDAANLDDSVSTGRAGFSLSINIPKADYGGVMIVTVEVMPERLYERQRDEYLYVTAVEHLPNALRDVQRAEPVDTVLNSRIDQAHTSPNATFGYEPMNAKWKRERTTLGGEFRQTTPGTPITTARTAIWQADYVDPAFTSDHWLCLHPFPQDVFSVPANDIVNIGVTQAITITGITQFGDELVEDNSDFATVAAEV